MTVVDDDEEALVASKSGKGVAISLSLSLVFVDESPPLSLLQRSSIFQIWDSFAIELYLVQRRR